MEREGSTVGEEGRRGGSTGYVGAGRGVIDPLERATARSYPLSVSSPSSCSRRQRLLARATHIHPYDLAIGIAIIVTITHLAQSLPGPFLLVDYCHSFVNIERVTACHHSTELLPPP